MLHLWILFAEGEAPPKTPQGPGPGMDIMLIMMALFFLFYFIVMRPGIRRRENEQKALRENLKKNDKILTTGGIYGTVVAVSDTDDEVTVKVDDNVRLRMVKSSILRNLTNEEAAREAKEAAKTARNAG